ncbi:MAG: hypothetical protein ACAH11_02255 [Sphingomonas sp.]
MASDFEAKPPVWFWVVAGFFVLWQLTGCFAYYQYGIVGPEDPYQKALGESMPAWYWWVFGIAIVTGTLSALALVARKAWAKPLALVSLIAVILQYGYVLGTSDLIAHEGLVGAAGFPAFIALLGAAMLWFANLSRSRGWIS